MNDFSVPTHLKSTTSDVVHHTSTAPQSIDAHEDLGYYPIAFISCCLPYRDPRKRSDILAPAETFSWTRQNGPVSLNLTAGTYIDGSGNPQLHLPFGRYARILLMWLTTSALKHQSQSFPLPTSARELLTELNITWGSARARDIITQLRALLATQCVVTHHEKRGDNFVDISEERFTIGTRTRLHFSTDENYCDFDPSTLSHVELSEQFYNYLVAGNFAPVLLTRWRQLIEENTSPLAADLFLWMAYRAPQISEDTYISWANLQTQVGSLVTPGRERDFAATVTRALGKVAEVYPEMNFSVVGSGARRGFRGLILHPSPDADLLGLNPRLAYEAIAQAQEAAEASGLAPSSEVHRDVNLQKLRGELIYHGLDTAESAADAVLCAAIDVVLDRAKITPGCPQAFVRVCILREPALLTGAATPVAPAQAPVAPAVPGQGVAPVTSSRPVLPVASCPVHGEDVTGLVCRDCAIDLKSLDTDAAVAAECWDAVSARLKNLTEAGFDITDETARYQALAIARGVTLSI